MDAEKVGKLRKAARLVLKYRKTAGAIVTAAATAIADGATGWQVVKAIVDIFK